MKELTYTPGWNGGHFNFSTDEVMDKWIIIVDEYNGHHEAYITGTTKRSGIDNDMGHTYHWNNLDFIYEIPEDVFDRKSSLLNLFNRKFKIFLKDE